MGASAKSPTGAYFINSGGETVKVPLEKVNDVVDLGWTPASQKQVDDLKLQQKYGGVGQQAITAVEGVASGATFGVSTAIERATGMSSAEDIKGREQANPWTHGIGAGVGMVAPLVATGGAGGAAEAGAVGAAEAGEAGVGALARGAAEYTAPALAARAGKAVTGAVSAALPEASGIAGRVLGSVVPHAAGSLVEGTALGLGQVVHEAALGDPDQVAQSALATVGMSALFGGAVGAAGGLLGGLAKEASASELGAKLADWAGEVEGNRNIKAAGAIQGDITRVAKQIGRKGLNKIGQEMGELGLVGPGSTPASTLEKAEQLLDSSGKGIGDLLQGADAAAPEAAPSVGQVIDRVRNEVLDPLSKNPLQREAASRLEQGLQGYLDKFAQPGSFGKGTLSLESLHGMRKEISDSLYGLRGNQDPFANAYKEALSKWRGIVSDEIQEGVARAGASTEEWKALNRQYQVASTAADFANKGLDRAHGNNLISLTEGLGALGGGLGAGPVGALASGAATALVRRHASGVIGFAARGLRNLMDSGAVDSVTNKTADALAAARHAGADTLSSTATSAPETVAVLAHLERANQAVENKIDHWASIVARGSDKAEMVARDEVSAGISKSLGHDPEKSLAQFNSRVADIKRVVGNAEQMQSTLTRLTEGISEHAPNIAQAAQMTAVRMLTFLASKIPQPPDLGPLAPKTDPSPAEIAKWNRSYEVAVKPTRALKQMAAGTLTKEAVEALSYIHPQSLSKMQSSLLKALAMHPGKVPYRSKMMLSLLMSKDMDGSTRGPFILANQRSLTGPSSKGPENQAGSPGIKPTAGGMAKLNVSNRLLTPMQSALRRGDR